MQRGVIALALLGSFLAGCATAPTPTARPSVVVEAPPPDRAWERTVTLPDRQRIDTLVASLARARALVPKRRSRAVAAEGALLDPAAAQTVPQTPPGPYYRRLIRFGGRAGFATFKPDVCYIEGATDALAFTKQTGSNLPEGYFYEDGDRRQVFLGTFRAAGDRPGVGYGNDPARDIVGVVERVSPFRWRLILSRAGRGAALDIYELVPLTPQVPGAAPAVPSN